MACWELEQSLQSLTGDDRILLFIRCNLLFGVTVNNKFGQYAIRIVNLLEHTL